MGLLPYIRVYGHVYLRLMLYVPQRILGITMERRYGQYSVTNCRSVGAMLGCWCDVSAFDLRRSMCRPSKIEGRCVNLRRSMINVSTFEDRCVDFRRSTIDVSTFEDRCVDLRKWMIDVPTFEDRWSLC